MKLFQNVYLYECRGSFRLDQVGLRSLGQSLLLLSFGQKKKKQTTKFTHATFQNMLMQDRSYREFKD